MIKRTNTLDSHHDIQILPTGFRYRTAGRRTAALQQGHDGGILLGLIASQRLYGKILHGLRLLDAKRSAKHGRG